MNKTKIVLKTIGVLGSVACGSVKGIWGFGKQCVQIKNMIAGQSEKAKQEAAAAASDYEVTLQEVKDQGFDVMLIGAGIFLHTKALAEIAPEVLHAYQLAYPVEFARQDFIDQVANLKSPEAIMGFTNGLKGKLFEIEYAKDLNNHLLPEGYHAALAASANQPGYDILITGPDNQLAETLQLKATHSLDYIKHALEKYPDIKIAATDEVLSSVAGREIVAQGHVVASGISEHALAEQVHHEIGAAQDSFFSISHQIPLLSLSIILFHEALKKNKTLNQKSFSAGERGARSIVNFKVGAAISSVVGGIPAILAIIGFHYFGNKAEADTLLTREYQKITKIYQQKKMDLQIALHQRNSWWWKVKSFFGLTPNI